MTPDRSSKYPFLPAAVATTITGGSGSYLHTADGRRILDGGGGAIVTNIGHGRTEAAEAAAAAMTGAAYVVPTWATEHRIRLIEHLQDKWLPPGMTRCLFVSGGSESVDSAIRIARQYHVARGDIDRWKIVGIN